MTYIEWIESMKSFKWTTRVDGHLEKTVFEDGTTQFAFIYEKNGQKLVKIVDIEL